VSSETLTGPRLPRTKDGVEVGWCSFVYNRNGTRYVVIDFWRCQRDIDLSDPDRRLRVGDFEYMHVTECYSGRELVPAEEKLCGG
jgi:hypothetical protein